MGNIMKHGLVRGDGVWAIEILGRTVSKEVGIHPKWPASFIRGMEMIEPLHSHCWILSCVESYSCGSL